MRVLYALVNVCMGVLVAGSQLSFMILESMRLESTKSFVWVTMILFQANDSFNLGEKRISCERR